MKLCIAVVFASCIIGAIAEDNSYYGSVREAFSLYNECSKSEGLSPCLKMKALSVIERISRMEKLSFFDGVVITGKTEEIPNEPSLEEVEKTLPRSLDAKSQALTSMIFNRIARMIGSKSIEISVPTLVESARKKGEEDDDKFSALSELLGDKFGGSGGGDKEGLLSKFMKKGKKKGGEDMMKGFFMKMMAHKMAMIPLFIAGLFLLAVKALTQAKIALLIAGIIFGKKLLASKGQGGGGGKPHHVEHVQAGWSGGAGAGGWSGGAGGWSGGAGGGGWSGGGEDGWKRRSLEGAQTLAYQGQQHAS